MAVGYGRGEAGGDLILLTGSSRTSFLIVSCVVQLFGSGESRKVFFVYKVSFVWR
jgi:hypothetical protein